MGIFQPGIGEYVKELPQKSPSPLDEMEQYAAEHGFPIIGPLVGRVLQQLVVLTGAKRVFELGSGYGYSALWMARVISADGKITCTDTDPENERRAKEYFKRAGLESKLDFRCGEAIAEFEKEVGPYDLVLNDIDKEHYPATIKLVKERLRPGGVFVTDNILWSGRVLDSSPDAATAGILKFTHELYNDPGFMTSIIPLRDGISVAIKK
ncbi:MAG: O-methyltransferase [candidate division Zixibacteria bacterium]|nr:O-methyltransferase [candidate division Zixibacteria bacterium]MBU1471534.1 O-methyltransferase [candidate division Zixibacteria bacterium]MBU2625883.1 O-methyltransferase [candidate division Zixibacteria bacterium]